MATIAALQKQLKELLSEAGDIQDQLVTFTEETFGEKNRKGFKRDIIDPELEALEELIFGGVAPQVNDEPVQFEDNPLMELISQLGLGLEPHPQSVVSQGFRGPGTPEVNDTPEQLLPQDLLAQIASQLGLGIEPHPDSLISQGFNEAGPPEVNSSPVPGDIGIVVDDLLGLLSPDAGAEAPLPPEDVELSEFDLEGLLNEGSQFLTPEDVPELTLPEVTQEAIEFDVGASSLQQEKQRLIAKSDAGLATQADRLKYQSIVDQLGEVPIFDDVIGDEGFTVTGEFGKPKPDTGIDTSGLGGVESLVALQKYQGKLLSDRQRIEEEANKVANTSGPILQQLAVAINDAQGLADPLAKRFAQEDIANLQAQLSVAQEQDKQLREEFITSNIGEIDQQLKGITPQIEAARIIAAQEQEAKSKTGDVPDYVLKLVAMDNPGKDPKEIIKGLPRELAVDYFIRGQEAIRTPYAEAVAVTPAEQERLDEYHKGAFFAQRPELYEAMDIFRENFKIPAIKRVQRNPENFTEGLAVARPQDREELIKVAIRNEVNRMAPRFADGQFVTNLDWLSIDGNKDSIDLVNDLKSKGFTSWEKAIDALPKETKADQLLVAKMITNFTDRFSETYAPMGISIDLSKYFSRYQRSLMTRTFEQFRSPGTNLR